MGAFRFLLATMVVMLHTSLEFGSNFYNIYSPIPMQMVIPSFFMISGFIIMLSLNKNYTSGNNFLSMSSKYYVNRALRIYPLYFLSILMFYTDVFILNIIKPSDFAINYSYILDPTYILSNLVLIFQNTSLLPTVYIIDKTMLINTSAWSLDIELQWYLYAPIIFYFFYYKFNATYLRIIFYLIIIREGPFHDYRVEQFSYLNFFILGLLTYDFYLLYESKFQNKLNTKYLLILSTLLIISYPILSFYINGNISNYNHWLLEIQQAAYVDRRYNFFIKYNAIYYLYWIGLATLCLSVNFKNKTDKILGDLSYPIFILHVPFFYMILMQVNKYCNIFFGINHYDSMPFVFIVSFIFFVIFCYFALWLFQYPLDRLRNKIKS